RFQRLPELGFVRQEEVEDVQHHDLLDVMRPVPSDRVEVTRLHDGDDVGPRQVAGGDPAGGMRGRSHGTHLVPLDATLQLTKQGLCRAATRDVLGAHEQHFHPATRPDFTSSPRIHSYVRPRPSSRLMTGSQSSTLRRSELSLLRPRTPCGLLRSCCFAMCLPATFATMSTSSSIVIMRSWPRLSGSRKSDRISR